MTEKHKSDLNKIIDTIIHGEAWSILKTMPDECIDCVVTSPPYWALRDYGVAGQLGLEPTFHEYVTRLCDIFNEIQRVLKNSGTCWVNIGDTYNAGDNYRKDGATGRAYKYSRTEFLNCKVNTKKQGLQVKSLLQIPSHFAIEMTCRGWILRNEIIWYKPNCMPSSVADRFTVDFEKIFFFTKKKNYFFNQQREPLSQISVDRAKYGLKTRKANVSRNNSTGIDISIMGERFAPPKGRNKRAVWKIPTSVSRIAHMAMFPEKLIETPIKAGCPVGGIVLDPFMGAGTTAVVAKQLDRHFIGIELNQEFIKIAEKRINSSRNFKTPEPHPAPHPHPCE